MNLPNKLAGHEPPTRYVSRTFTGFGIVSGQFHVDRVYTGGRSAHRWAKFVRAMKMQFAIPFVFVIVGCTSTPSSRVEALTSEQATAIAQQLANEKAQGLYDCQPFHNGAPARLDDSHWFWTDRRPYGAGDVEATVILSTDGSPRSVEVVQLDSRREAW